MIVADTSALLAIVLGEAEASTCAAALANADVVILSAGTAAEARIVAMMKGIEVPMDDLLSSLPVVVLPVDSNLARLSVDAYRQFGKGRHPARLNYGDCFAYAVAKHAGLALLFKGNDFSQTDLASVL